MAIGYTSTNANARTSFASLLKHRGEVREVFYNTFESLEELYPKFCAVDSSNAQYENENVVGGRPKWTVTSSEGEEYTFGDLAQGTEIQYVNLEYKDAFDVTKVMMEDNQFSNILASAAEMARGGKDIVEEKANDVLDNAFSSGTGADGSYLCVTTHNLINSGSTGSNALALKLSGEALKQAKILARKVVDEANIYVRVKYDTLVVTPTDEEMAIQLMKSEKVPETNANAVNANMSEISGISKLCVTPYAATDTQWFLVASGNDKKLKPRFFWRVHPEFETDKDVYSGNILFKARERFVAGFTAWQHIIGSTGLTA